MTLPLTASPDDAGRLWLDSLKARRFSPRTLEAYGHAFRGYVAHLAGTVSGPLTLEDVVKASSADLRGWMARLRGKTPPLSARSLAQDRRPGRRRHESRARWPAVRCNEPARPRLRPCARS